MNIKTINGCIFLAASAGTIFGMEILTCLSGLFCVLSVYKLLREDYRISVRVYSVLMVLYSVLSLCLVFK